MLNISHKFFSSFFKKSQILALVFIILAFIYFFLSSSAQALTDDNKNLNAQTESENSSYLRDLEAGAEDFVRENIILEENETLELQTSKINDNKIIPICEGELKYSIASGKIRKNNTIKAQCHSATTPWSIYIVVRAYVKTPFVTVTNDIPKGAIFTEKDLTISYIDKTLDRGFHFTDPALLVGIKTKRNIKPGQPIQKNQVCVVCNGSLVTIEASNSLVSVKTDGEALQDGSFNDKIKVRNLKTGKIIQATVVNSSLVRISFN